VIAARVEQNGKAPGISEGDQTRFSWKEVYVHDPEIGNLLARHLRPVQPGALLWIEDCRQCQITLSSLRSERMTDLMSRPTMLACIFSVQSRPLGSRRYVFEVTGCTAHPCRDWVVAYARSARHLEERTISRCAFVLKRGERLTGDIEVENIVIIGRIVYQLPASLIHNQDFPL
jgi:hypothetical protein